MREVFGERGNQNIQAARADKPTEVGDAVNRQNPDETQMNTGGILIRGYPRRGDRCGDTLNSRILAFIKNRILGKVGSQMVH